MTTSNDVARRVFDPTPTNEQSLGSIAELADHVQGIAGDSSAETTTAPAVLSGQIWLDCFSEVQKLRCDQIARSTEAILDASGLFDRMPYHVGHRCIEFVNAHDSFVVHRIGGRIRVANEVLLRLATGADSIEVAILKWQLFVAHEVNHQHSNLSQKLSINAILSASGGDFALLDEDLHADRAAEGIVALASSCSIDRLQDVLSDSLRAFPVRPDHHPRDRRRKALRVASTRATIIWSRAKELSRFVPFGTSVRTLFGADHSRTDLAITFSAICETTRSILVAYSKLLPGELEVLERCADTYSCSHAFAELDDVLIATSNRLTFPRFFQR